MSTNNKTVKRFLTSVMTLAMAGGSVLAFGSIASAQLATDEIVFDGTVAASCTADTPASDASVDYSTSTTSMLATNSAGFQCNSDTIDVKVEMTAFTRPTSAPTVAVRHSVDVQSIAPGPAVDLTEDIAVVADQQTVVLNAANVLIIDDGIGGIDAATATDGSIDIQIASTLDRADAGLLPQGTYQSTFLITLSQN